MEENAVRHNAKEERQVLCVLVKGLIQARKYHDWYFEMSDSHRVHEKGRTNLASIHWAEDKLGQYSKKLVQWIQRRYPYPKIISQWRKDEQSRLKTNTPSS